MLLSVFCPLVFFFFFSSRRRHTRCLSDWSSDVCSSDIVSVAGTPSDVVNLAAVYRALDQRPERADVEHLIVHTGPSDEGTAALCEQLETPRSHRSLDVDAGPHGAGGETGLALQRLAPP